MRSPQNRSTLKIGTLFLRLGAGVVNCQTGLMFGWDVMGGVEPRELNEDDQK